MTAGRQLRIESGAVAVDVPVPRNDQALGVPNRESPRTERRGRGRTVEDQTNGLHPRDRDPFRGLSGRSLGKFHLQQRGAARPVGSARCALHEEGRAETQDEPAEAPWGCPIP